MSNNKPTRKIAWTEEDRVRHRAIREKFRDWHPSPEELIASGEGANFEMHGEFQGLRAFLESLKRARESAGLTLAEVSQRCGIDQPALSRLENGRNPNPTLDTLWKYAAALGKRLLLSAEDLPPPAAAQPKGPARRGASGKRNGRKAAASPGRKRRGEQE